MSTAMVHLLSDYNGRSAFAAVARRLEAGHPDSGAARRIDSGGPAGPRQC
ncbi:unnamed protein product [Mycetohabitans rhizoxinica HKI 454]|uniref:Uncharacterized protein n=1 Tax=Mycetohabitans rhizoxinica (strain DSM 19002 / CIP 109453 / HKI 454) TaxID=882378 RepID=E5AM88_MYCRK|nr:unnamed protein product [Mycetohabitans rhizoxinica HKI 454]